MQTLRRVLQCEVASELPTGSRAKELLYWLDTGALTPTATAKSQKSEVKEEKSEMRGMILCDVPQLQYALLYHILHMNEAGWKHGAHIQPK